MIGFYQKVHDFFDFREIRIRFGRNISLEPMSFNIDFCSFLEYHLSGAFRNSEDSVFSGFWCDGILMPNELELNPKHVNDTRQIVTKAFIGPTGQDRYTMIIKFGPKALSRYTRGISLEMCVPDADAMNWLIIDEIEKRIDLYLK